MRYKLGKLLFLWLIVSSTAYAAKSFPPCQKICDCQRQPWSFMAFHGWMTDNDIANILFTPRHVRYAFGHVTSIELAYELSEQNWFRRILSPFVSTVQVAGNASYRQDPIGPIYEFAPYFILRWQHFPWDRWISTSIGIGEGLSYASSVPFREMHQTNNPKRIMNYVQFEATVGLPQFPHWQLVALVHHRCGAWGALGAGNSSSNAVGVGIRVRF